MPLRSSNRSSQQRVTWSKYDQTWSLQRPQLHEFNYLKKIVSKNNVARDIKRKLCYDGDDKKCRRRSQCMSKCMFSMVKTARTQHCMANMTAMHEMAAATSEKSEETKRFIIVTLLQECLKEMPPEKCFDSKKTAEYFLSASVCGTDWYWCDPLNFKYVYLKRFKLPR